MSTNGRVVVLWMCLLACPVQNAHAWRVGINGKADKVDVANAVAIDAAGDVVAAGSISGVSASFSVVKLAATTGAEVWRREIVAGEAHALVLDGAGDALVAGSTRANDFSTDNFSVMKLAAATGEVLWRHDVAAVLGYATAVATDGAGDVVAVGHTAASGVHVAKLAGATGEVLWQNDLGGGGISYPYTGRVAVDGDGDVVVAGSSYNPGTRDDWLVAKLSGLTGSEIWRRELDGGMDGNEFADAVIVDATGNVTAAGYSVAPGLDGEFVVHRFSGTDGSDVWRQAVGSGVATTLALDAAGEIVAGGALAAPITFDDDFAIVRLSAATGMELWRATFGEHSSVYFPRDLAGAIRIRGDGAIVAAGVTETQRSGTDFTVAAFAGATGALLWRLDLDSGVRTGIDARYGDQAKAVAVGGTGDIVAVGSIDDQRKGPNFTVVQVSNGPATGEQLVVTDRGAPSRRSVKFKNADATLVTAARAGPNDPSIAGGAVRLTNPGTAEATVLALPAANWQARAVRGGVAWEYRDPAGLAGSCQSIRIEPLRRITAKCRGAGIGFSLDEALQGSLAIEIETGAMRYCALFGGTVAADRPGTFKARNAPVSASCP